MRRVERQKREREKLGREIWFRKWRKYTKHTQAVWYSVTGLRCRWTRVSNLVNRILRPFPYWSQLNKMKYVYNRILLAFHFDFGNIFGAPQIIHRIKFVYLSVCVYLFQYSTFLFCPFVCCLQILCYNLVSERCEGRGKGEAEKWTYRKMGGQLRRQ